MRNTIKKTTAALAVGSAFFMACGAPVEVEGDSTPQQTATEPQVTNTRLIQDLAPVGPPDLVAKSRDYQFPELLPIPAAGVPYQFPEMRPQMAGFQPEKPANAIRDLTPVGPPDLVHKSVYQLPEIGLDAYVRTFTGIVDWAPAGLPDLVAGSDWEAPETRPEAEMTTQSANSRSTGPN